MKTEDKRIYSVTRKKAEAAGITTLYLIPVEGDSRPFISGQFLTVYFPELGIPEGKAYSISSAPHEEEISITIKDIGVFSHRLCTLEEGDTLTASGPYGFFYSEEIDSTLILLAAGIGIAPLRSMICDALRKNPLRKIDLHYSVSKLSDAVFLDTFSFLQKEHPNFTYAIHVTKEAVAEPCCCKGRISVKQLVSPYKEDASAEYLMCGSIAFVRDMWRGLRAEGVPEDRLSTEAFFA